MRILEVENETKCYTLARMAFTSNGTFYTVCVSLVGAMVHCTLLKVELSVHVVYVITRHCVARVII